MPSVVSRCRPLVSLGLSLFVFGIFGFGFFANLSPARAGEQNADGPVKAASEWKLTKKPLGDFHEVMETAPFWYKGRAILLGCRRENGGTPDVKDRMYLSFFDLDTGDELARFASEHSFGSVYVEGDTVHAFAAEYTPNDWTANLNHFWSNDLKNWKQERAITRVGDEHLFNSSVCRDPQGYLMAFESNEPVQFCFRFARSKDLSKWEPVEGLAFTGEQNEYSACPAIRYFAPYYYVIYLHRPIEGHNGWISYLARSKDLETWELSPKNPILEASKEEGSNNSDVDLFERDGKTILIYATGDQATWADVKQAVYDGPMQEFFEKAFPAGQTFKTLSTRREAK